SPMVEDVSYVPLLAAPGVAAVPSFKPSTISPGLSFSGGFFVERELSDRLSISAGVNYLQLNTRTKVGEQVYGSQVVNNGQRGFLTVVNFYTVDVDPRATEYKNKYHFIEIPVQLHLQ